MNKKGILMVCSLACLPSLAPASAAERLAWELAPYRVQVAVAVAAPTRSAPPWQAEWERALAAELGARKGEAWQVQLAPMPPLADGVAPSEDDLPARAREATQRLREASEFDKIVLVWVSSAENAYQVTAWEFDVATRQWGGRVVRRAPDTAALAETSASAILDAFAPLARIEVAKGEEAVLRIRASHLPARDPAGAAIRIGDVFRPTIRIRAQGAALRRIAVPWTYCQVREVAADEVRCRVITALQDPWGGYRGNGTERLAVRVSSRRQTAELRLIPRGEQKQALGGLEVYALRPGEGTSGGLSQFSFDENGTVALGSARVLLGRTNRDGCIPVPAGGAAIETLLVFNEGRLLARLPLAPGVEDRLVAELALSDAEVETDAYLAALREEVLEIAARRQALLARAKAAAAAGQRAEAEQLLGDFRKLPPAAEAIHALVERRGPPPSGAQAAADALLAQCASLVAAADAKTAEQLGGQPGKTKQEPADAAGRNKP